MTVILLIIIYIAFIGLGIPDSLFGTAWPAIYSEFELPISYASFVTVIISCGTVVASLVSAKVIEKLGTAKVTAISTAMTAAALIGFSYSGNLFVLCLLAIPLGLGAGAIDSALNNYVALHYSAAHMSMISCLYGIGVSASPYILSLVINGESGWRGGYRIAFFIQAAITLLLFFTLPLWKKAHGAEHNVEEEKIKALPFKEIIKIPGVKAVWCMFFSSCAIEFTAGGWGSTFFVEYKHMQADAAARIITFYYIGMTIGRLLSGILSSKLKSQRIIKIGQYVLGAALIILALPLPAYASATGLFMIGLGNGPMFPNFTYLTPQNFGKDASQSVMGTQMAFGNIGVMLAPVICGLLGQFMGMGIFPFYLIALYLTMVISTIKLNKTLKVN